MIVHRPALPTCSISAACKMCWQHACKPGSHSTAPAMTGNYCLHEHSTAACLLLPGKGKVSEACALAALQILQWVFAAAPGHPALREMCEHVATHAMVSFGMADHDTLERTGPGPWTDIVLKHARLHPPSNVSSSVTQSYNTFA